MGIKANHKDDWYTFLDAVISNLLISSFCFLIFSYMRQRYRLVYQKNSWCNWGLSKEEERSTINDGVKEIEEDEHENWQVTGDCGGPLPSRPSGRFLDWIPASFLLRTPEIITSAGLDQAMLVQFANMGMMTFASIGIPMLLIIAPMHIFLGGNRAGDDYLSWQGFANVEQGSFLCWVHAIVVWMVVLLVDSQIYYCQEQFIKLRVRWLETLPHLEACTVLVEGIPLRCRTNNLLTKFFNRMFADRDVVECSHVLVRTERLEFEISARDAAKKAYDDAQRQEDAATSSAAEPEDDDSGPEDQNLSARMSRMFEESRRASSKALSDAMHATVKAFKEIYEVAEAEVLAERHRLNRQIRKVEKWSQEDIVGPQDEEGESLSPEEMDFRNQQAASRQIQLHWRNFMNKTKGNAQCEIPKTSSSSRLRSGDSTASASPSPKDRTMVSSINSSLGLRDMKYIEAMTKRTFLTPAQQELDQLYAAAAFVTFKTRYDAIMALRLVPYTPDREEFILSVAPDPADVHFDDMKKPSINTKAWTILGWILIGGMFFSFLPTIGLISAFANVHNLAPYDRSGTVTLLCKSYPSVVRVWNGIAGAMGLNLVLSFLPTILVLISAMCFQKKAHAWSQHQLQKYYFFFLIVFQLLVVSMANSLLGAMKDTVADPLSLVERLSNGMAQTTHFYLNIFASQWTVIGMEHTRMVQLIKYHLWKKMTSTPQEASEGAEPEDQDYYGMGARSARYTSLFVIGLAFASLCPLICVMAFVTFAIMRLVVGYQVVYAETKKPDLGGSFWVTSLKHLQLGLLIYIICMTGVLAERSDSTYPSLLAGSSVLYLIESILLFDNKFYWEAISREQVIEAQDNEARGDIYSYRKSLRDNYIQPELTGDLSSLGARLKKQIQKEKEEAARQRQIEELKEEDTRQRQFCTQSQ
jgi:hypothetical protein